MIVRITGMITWGDMPGGEKHIIGWEGVDTTLDIDIQDLLNPAEIWEAFLNSEDQAKEWWNGGYWLSIEELKIQAEFTPDLEHHIWVSPEDDSTEWQLESESGSETVEDDEDE